MTAPIKPRDAARTASSRRQGLSRERIASAALALADREGVEGLSMRRLAGELGVGTMSLYRHFTSKTELLAALVDTAAAESPAELDLAGAWTEQLRQLMRGVRATLARHPIAIGLRLQGPLLSPGALRVTEAGMQILERAGFDRAGAAHAYRALFLYTFGFAAFNSPAEPEEVMRRARGTLTALPPDQYPTLSAAAADAAETMAGDEQFEFGLDRIIAGLEAALPHGQRRGRDASPRGTVAKMPSDEDIDRAARTLAEGARSPARVVLFGSRARGDADPGSDIDFLVIEEQVQDTIREAARLARALPPLGVAVDVLVVSSGEAERRREWPGDVIKFALREGRVLAES